MGDGLLSSEPEGNADKTYSELFEEICPYYLSIGMSIEQFWEGDNTLVVYFRKAEELRINQRNYNAWLEGMYVYDAISRLYPLFNPYTKKGTKVKPYPDKPYPMAGGSEDKENVNKEVSNKGKAYLQNFANRFNKQFKERRER